MLRTTLSASAAALLALSLEVGLAQAQPARVFVAAQGADGNPCTFALPCRTFQHAHDTVVGGGEIDVLDPAGYGALTISKSISIQGHGFAGLAVASGDGITISAGATTKINLRGLLLDGIATGNDGIKFTTGGTLNIQDCLIRNFTHNGVTFSPSTLSRLSMSNTLVTDNGNFGIVVSPTGSGTASAVFDHVESSGNTLTGFLADGSSTIGTVDLAISESVAAHNSAGFGAASSGGASVVMVRNSTTFKNGTGLFANGTAATLRFTRTTVTGNNQGLATGTSGILASYGDNNIDGNTSAGATPSTIPLK